MSKTEAAFQAVRLNAWNDYLKLVDEVGVNQKNEYGQSFLHEAIAYRANQIVEHLINQGVDVNGQDINGQTPLHFAVAHGSEEMVKSLINAKADANLRDKFGNNPMWTATFNARGNYDIVRLLKDYGADYITKNRAGRSPRDFAAQIGDQGLLEILR